MVPAERNTRQKQVARHLLNLLDAFEQGRLPSTRDLSRIFSVSQATAMGALRRMASQGVVELRPCARPRLRCSQSDARTAPAQDSSSQRLYRELLAAISEGTYSIDTPLPKLGFFALKHHISENTVRKVYRRLIAEGLVFSIGKRFMVGRAHDRTRVSVRSRPSILLLGRGVNQWRSGYENARTRDFSEVFGREAQRSNTRLLMVTARKTAHHPSIAAAGMDDVLRLIQELDVNYCGCLILGDRASIPDLDDWSKALTLRNYPAVWLDRNDEGRAGLDQGVFRCHYSEESMVACALETLAQYNHHRGAFLYSRTVPWQTLRFRLLQEKAESLEPAMKVLGYPRYDAESFQNPFQSGVIPLLETIYPHCRDHVKESFDYMIRSSEKLATEYPIHRSGRWRESPFGGFCAFAAMNPSQLPGVDQELLRHGGKLWGMLALWPAVFRDNATAVLCPNDSTAVSFYLHHVASLGLRVPEKFSFVSFDNSYRDAFIPLSTVDAGFGTLGYQAFHLIAGDIPILRNRLRDIPARPQMIDRGSVGLPPAQNG